MEQENNERVVIMHGFEKEKVFEIMRAVKASVDNPSEIAFSVSTPTNLEWKLKDIISDVREDHTYFKEQERLKKEGK